MRKLLACFGYYKMDADEIITILDRAREQYELEGNDMWPLTYFTSQEIVYIQKALEETA